MIHADDLAAYMGIRARHEREWEAKRRTPGRWKVLRDVYAFHTPEILSTRSLGVRRGTDPYFLDWDFTPIEALAWQDIRGRGLPLVPQYPVSRYFLDFADPYFKIGVELDGAQWHDPVKDERRDDHLWSLGWRIFRIPGRESFAAPFNPLTDGRADDIDADEYRADVERWAMRWSEGVFWALDRCYYTEAPIHDGLNAAAWASLDAHRLVDFPLSIPRSD